MANKLVVPILYDTYIAVIKNSPGSNLFRNSYAKIGRNRKDILENGKRSCAFFASSILCIFNLIKEVHATVDGTLKDLRNSGWGEIKRVKIGSILVWEAMDFGNGDAHKHIGFYVGKNKAISNFYKARQPIIHHWTFGAKKGKPIRKIEAIFWNKKFD